MSTLNNYFTFINLFIALFIAIFIVLLVSLFKKKKKLSIYFHGHVNPEVLNLIVKKYNKIKISGEEKIVTVMFIDIKGFTCLSERLTNKKIFSMLNTYFGDISDIIFEHHGTVDKYIGDAVMAF